MNEASRDESSAADELIDNQAIALEIFEYGLRKRIDLAAPLLLHVLSQADDPIRSAISITSQIIGTAQQLLEGFGCDLAAASEAVSTARSNLLAGGGEGTVDAG